MAEKLIPGIPEGTRIAILQQSKLTEEDEDGKSDKTGSVLVEVVDKATAKTTVERDITCTADAFAQ